MELLLRGDEQLLIDKADNNRLKEIRGYHAVSRDGDELICDLVFYDAHITEDGELDANCVVYEDGEKKMFDVIVH